MPYNDITKNFFYNNRIIISTDLYEPLAWRVTKIEPFAHRGNIMYTSKQDKWDDHHDYIEKDGNKIIGMWADYFNEFNLPSNVEKSDDAIGNYAEITYSGIDPHIKVNGSYKKITITYYNVNKSVIDQTPGVWSYLVDGVDVSDLIKTTQTDTPNSIKIKWLGDETYLGKILLVRNVRDNIVAELQLQIVSL